ncbi:Asialoglycoprotein receptor 1, partial [Ophiophagus hannah]
MPKPIAKATMLTCNSCRSVPGQTICGSGWWTAVAAGSGWMARPTQWSHSRFNWRDWCPDQPDNWYNQELGGGEDCAHLHHNGCWNDDHCSRLYGSICEMEMDN